MGYRKLYLTGMGLVTLSILGLFATYGHLPSDALDTLAWAVVVTTSAGVGGNAAEHYAKRPIAATAPTSVVTGSL